MMLGGSLARMPKRLGWLARAGMLAAALGATAGCAIPPPTSDQAAVAAFIEANDPYEPLNRSVFAFNRALDVVLIRPAAEAYRFVVPEGVRHGVHNALNHLDTPNILVNDFFQGNLPRAAESAQRLVMNTLVGAGGVFDIAAMDYEGEIKPAKFHKEDFGQTLGVWGFGEGPYLVLPLFGPSNFRDAFGSIVDSFIDPLDYIVPRGARSEFFLVRRIVKGLDSRSRVIESLDDIERDSIDFYAAIRSLYRQHRAAEIRNGESEPLPAPDVSLKFDDDVAPEVVASLASN
jgi:phospholipid-binding lipoprotein MlaA